MKKVKEIIWPPAPLEGGGLPFALYQKGVRGVSVAWPLPGTEGETAWSAWGEDGLEADWRALGLADDLERVARAVVLLVRLEGNGYPGGWRVDEARLYLGPQGWTLVVQAYDMDQGRPRTVAYVHGQPPEAPVEPMWPQQTPRSLRERMAYLLARYPTWYRHEAPRAWRGHHRPEPTLEALLEWGRKRGEWTKVEEKEARCLLREMIGD